MGSPAGQPRGRQRAARSGDDGLVGAQTRAARAGTNIGHVRERTGRVRARGARLGRAGGRVRGRLRGRQARGQRAAGRRARRRLRRAAPNKLGGLAWTRLWATTVQPTWHAHVCHPLNFAKFAQLCSTLPTSEPLIGLFATMLPPYSCAKGACSRTPARQAPERPPPPAPARQLPRPPPPPPAARPQTPAARQLTPARPPARPPAPRPARAPAARRRRAGAGARASRARPQGARDCAGVLQRPGVPHVVGVGHLDVPDSSCAPPQLKSRLLKPSRSSAHLLFRPLSRSARKACHGVRLTLPCLAGQGEG